MLAIGDVTTVRAAPWTFVDVTTTAGIGHVHGFVGGLLGNESRMSAGGATAGDFDRDGWLDLYCVHGNTGPNLLYRNRGDGTFEEVAAAAGVSGAPALGSGPLFVDLDGDGWLDLAVGSLESAPALYRNRRDGTFEDVSTRSGIDPVGATFSIAAGDFDHDGRIDLATSHWVTDPVVRLWHNEGVMQFREVTVEAGLDGTFINAYAPTFADLDADGWPDLLVTGDFGTSRVYMNQRDGTFVPREDPVLTDENGMGSAVADYDNDGDLDWFVSSIWDPDGITKERWGVSGNRLYRNTGAGAFEDATAASGLREGYWGWGSSLADLDNDGDLDLLQVNGWPTFNGLEFNEDPTRLFVSQGGSFVESSAALGITDIGQGRGVVCFDYDRDGDLDLFIANNAQAPRLFRNDGGNAAHFLEVTLEGEAPNTQALGARIHVITASGRQMREIHAGSNYVSNDPASAHFGLAQAADAGLVCVTWPDGALTVRSIVTADTRILMSRHGGDTEVGAQAFTATRSGAGIALAWRVTGGGFLQLQRVTPSGPVTLRSGIEPEGSLTDTLPNTGDLRYRLLAAVADHVVAELAAPAPPPALRLARATPNPFAGRVRLDAELPATMGGRALEVAVYNVQGRRVRLLARSTVAPGATSFEWDGNDDHGRALGSGLYFVRLESGGVSRSLKVALAR